MNNPDTPALIAKIAAGPYAAEFRKVWGAGIFDKPDAALEAVAASIAAFERTRVLQPFTSKFDHVVRGQAKFTELEQRGLGLFSIRQKGNCASCHSVDEASRDPAKSLFTDFTYHALGTPRSSRIPKNADTSFHDVGLCERVPMSGAKVVKDPAECGLFKTPTLRNIALSGPYMHNGFFDNLRDAVAYYATRDTDPQKWFPGGRKFNDLPEQHHANVDVDTPPYQRRPGQRAQLNDEETDDIVSAHAYGWLQTVTTRVSTRAHAVRFIFDGVGKTKTFCPRSLMFVRPESTGRVGKTLLLCARCQTQPASKRVGTRAHRF